MISLGALAGYLGAITLLMITPGPDMMFVLANASRYGARAGITAALGVATGEALHVAAVVVGLAAVLTASPTLFACVRYAGAAYLILLGIRALCRRDTVAAEPAGNQHAYLRGLVTNVLNPKMILFSVAFLPQFVRPDAGNPAVQLVILGALFIAVQLVVDISIAACAGQLSRHLTHGRARRYLNQTCAGVFIVLGIHLAAG